MRFWLLIVKFKYGLWFQIKYAKSVAKLVARECSDSFYFALVLYRWLLHKVMVRNLIFENLWESNLQNFWYPLLMNYNKSVSHHDVLMTHKLWVLMMNILTWCLKVTDCINENQTLGGVSSLRYANVPFNSGSNVPFNSGIHTNYDL